LLVKPDGVVESVVVVVEIVVEMGCLLVKPDGVVVVIVVVGNEKLERDQTSRAFRPREVF